MVSFRPKLPLIGLLAALLTVSTAAGAQTAPAGFQLELNNASNTEAGGCQLTYVATNGSDKDLSQTAWQVGVFDSGGVVRRILVMEFGALPPGKTRIVLFNLTDQSCTDISRIIVNEVAQCTLASGEASDVCMTGLATSSRTDIQFGM